MQTANTQTVTLTAEQAKLCAAALVVVLDADVLDNSDGGAATAIATLAKTLDSTLNAHWTTEVLAKHYSYLEALDSAD
jgi:hypothetical protein